MEKNDMSISRDDLSDIFGKSSDDIKKLPNLPAEAVKTESAAEKPKLVMDRANEAYLIQEKASAEAKAEKKNEPAASGAGSAGRDTEQIVREFNDIKKALAAELAGKIDARSIDNMMLRTIEKQSVNFPCLKSTAWDDEGNLVADGTINPARFMKNMELYSETIKESGAETEEALKAVLGMRLRAIKGGLGADAYAAIKHALSEKLKIIEAGYKKETAIFVRKNIFESALIKAEE